MCNRFLKTVVLATTILCSLAGFSQGKKSTDFKYKANWESIRKHYKHASWFQDAKFGIFVIWGPYAVPAYRTEKYPKFMYITKNGTHKYHTKTYGTLDKFGYKDFIPMFKGEKFDASNWAKLFKKSGAKYVIPIAEHHDGFAMYNSKHTKWNSVNMGPKLDALQLLKDACKAEGLKFGASSHYARNRNYYIKDNPEFDTYNPEFEGLYWKKSEPDKRKAPSKEFLDHWWDRTVDIIDQYEPDVLWFDAGLDKPGFAPVHKKLLAYYYNKGLEWNKEVVFQDKNLKYESFPEDLIILDIERGRMSDKREQPWQTDTAIGKKSWGYITNEEYKTSNDLIDELIDIVSKNGALLLSVGPKADGTIPDEAVSLLEEMGAWLAKNGEAVYGTRTWKIFGEGPTEVVEGNLSEKNNKSMTAQDVRFTTKGENLYATVLDWPEGGTFLIKSLAEGNPHETRKISKVSFISGNNTISWKQTKAGLEIKVDANKPCEEAYAFKINF